MLGRRSLPLLALIALAIVWCGGSGDGGGEHSATIETTAVGPGAATEIQGPFAGKLRQAGLAPFRIGVVIQPDGTGLVAYTGIDCGGRWTLESRTPPEYTFFEEIGRGSGGECKGTGTVHLVQTRGGTVRYRFEGGGITSAGFLVPASPRAVSAIWREAVGVNTATKGPAAGCASTTNSVASTTCSARRK